MKVAVFGGSGFVGSHLIKELAEQGEEVVLVSRSMRPTNHEHVTCLTWRELDEQPDKLEGCNAFVNLAGESINQRWTQSAKQRIVRSRLEATGRVARIVERLKMKPEVVVNGSGMSIYGYSEERTFDETSPGPERLNDFLAQTVDVWEQAAEKIQGVRLVKLRIGLVLGSDGGALPLMLLPYRLFVGGKIGNGQQWHSWIHIKDMVGIIKYCIDHNNITGPVNCTAPNPVNNDEFGRTAGKVLKRPHWFPVPAWILQTLMGEMSEVLLKGQRVIPGAMLEHGYVFSYAALERALKNLTRKPEREVRG